MRKRETSGGVTVQAVAGNHAVYFGLDLTEDARTDCMGFAVHRTDKADPQSGRWLSAFKTFKSIVPNPDRTATYLTTDHPLQTFYWGDYTTKPGHDYTYRFVPRYGAPASLADKAGVEVSVDVSTNDPDRGTHGVYFNRGVAASQAYAEKFGQSPDKLPPDKQKEALTWLSRGLIEAILAFIGTADSDQYALRAAVYEFSQDDVLAAFRSALDKGADVKIVYHALADGIGDENRTKIAEHHLDDPAVTIPRTHTTIAHNKFIVLCTKDAAGNLTPQAVWTGSTNFSEGGIYGHSNVGHAVRDEGVARQYLDLWTELSGDPEQDAMRDWTGTNSPFDQHTVATDGIHTLFSPRHGLAPLNWYASEFGGDAGLVSAHITEAFGMNTLFETALEGYTGDGLHYVMLDKADNNQAAWATNSKVFVAVGSSGGPSDLRTWAKEQLTGYNPNVPYLHTKILLVNALSAAPTVITGSANFSPASTNANDENMLVIQNDPEVADVYFTEYARIFEHFYARYWAHKLSTGAADADTHSFLDETAGWQARYFVPGNPKCLSRTLYSSQVEGNA